MFNPFIIGGIGLASVVIIGFGIVMEVFRVFFFIWAIGIFLYSVFAAFILGKLRTPESEPLIKRNIAEHLSYPLAKHLLSAGNSPKASDVLNAAAQTQRGAFFVRSMGLEPEHIAQRFREYGGDEEKFEITRFLKTCRKMTQTLEEPVIHGHIVLYICLSEYQAGQTLVRKADLAQEDVSVLLEWETLRYYNREGKAKLTPQSVQDPSRTIGRFWSFGYTNTLDTITQNVTQKLQYREPYEVVIHQDQLKRGLSVLLQSERNNLMILGDIGVGKHTFVENVAHRLFRMEFKRDRVPTRVLTLNIPEFLSGTQNPDTFFLQALTEAEQAGNIVLVIDEISVLLKGDNTNLRQILQRFLDSPRISIVGIENSSNYHTVIKDNSQFTRSFEVLNIPEIEKEETYRVLMMEAVRIENTQNIQITYQSLKQIYRFCERYMIQESFPGKGVDTLQKAVQKALSERHSMVLENHIREAIKEETNIDVTRLNDEDREKLLNLEETLQEEIVGQNEALTTVTNALKRARVDVRDRESPLGTFLFLGPTGVGKTETAKSLARNYFGSEDRLIRLDMNEFSQSESVYSIIGAPVGSNESATEGYLTQQVQEHPFSLILLDELEKAHSEVLNTFLQIFDEGTLTDNRGIQTDFRYTIIIATSNAGALFVRNFFRENEEFQKEAFRKQLIDRIVEQGDFAPEFVNRFTKIVVYYPLKPEEVRTITRSMIDQMRKRFQKERGVTLEVSDDVIEFLAEEGYSLDYGARELERTVTHYLETYLADYLLLHEVERGDTIRVTKEQLTDDEA